MVPGKAGRGHGQAGVVRATEGPEAVCTRAVPRGAVGKNKPRGCRGSELGFCVKGNGKCSSKSG